MAGLNEPPRRASALGRQCVGRVSRLEATAVGSADLKQLACQERQEGEKNAIDAAGKR
ncbi:MAG: hypothetical protein RMY29_025560 [Nostoc sp. CreGUA01]